MPNCNQCGKWLEDGEGYDSSENGLLCPDCKSKEDQGYWEDDD